MALSQDRPAITYCSLEALRARGWTPLLVRSFLGAPDRTEPVELFLSDRVRQTEQSAEFLAARELRRRRARAQREAQARRRAAGLAAIRDARLALPRLTTAELAARAVAHRNLLDARRATLSWGHHPRAVSAAELGPAELARWQVRWLFEQLAPHAALVDALPPGASRAEGQRLLTGRCWDAIAAAYPALRAECARARAAASGDDRPEAGRSSGLQ
ncbi:hypothetical protein RM844_02145 [Streptomyces sp. DSM 44915]|uniref:Uncharacterized protein n=1 Tax=Streptomyces chisholmiae TaxID=3075540 RepID=A0ABU2JKP8_9ACTN|nr:hypothetical protein [Streptomyces sp. DSM 44915]MDT0265084.1 hypothetical protein [Streptomyces sp. DSM 44915]